MKETMQCQQSYRVEMMRVLNAIASLDKPSLGSISAKLGLDRTTVNNMILRAGERDQVRITKKGLFYKIEDWGLISREGPFPGEVALIEACIRRLQTGKPIANVERREYIALYHQHKDWFTVRNYPTDTAGLEARSFKVLAERRMRGK